MSQGPKRARAVAIALRRRRPEPLPDWMWLALAALMLAGFLLAQSAYAQTSVPPPGTVTGPPPERVAPTLPPGAGGDAQAAKPLPETSARPSVVPPRTDGDMPVIAPPAAGVTPVIPPPGTAGGEKGVVPK